jgi:hypothetical protein
LARNRLFGDFRIGGQQKGFTQNHGQGLVAFEGVENAPGLTFGGGTADLNDAQILVVGFHQDIAAAKVNFVSSDLAVHDQEFIGQLALAADF